MDEKAFFKSVVNFAWQKKGYIEREYIKRVYIERVYIERRYIA